MTSPISNNLKARLAFALALLVFLVGVRSTPAAAAGADVQEVPAQVPDNERPPADEPGPAGASTGSQAGPRLQLQDDPGGDSDRMRRSRARAAAADEVEERPFWKSWIFWAVTGVLVAGVIGMVVYTAPGPNSSLAPCPPDVVVSLGCFGTGR